MNCEEVQETLRDRIKFKKKKEGGYLLALSTILLAEVLQNFLHERYTSLEQRISLSVIFICLML